MKVLKTIFRVSLFIIPFMSFLNQVNGGPYVFWVNNNYDRTNHDSVDGTVIQDDLLAASCPYSQAPTPDCEYRDASGNRVIPCTRDLEDFARLWMAGVDSNLIAQLPTGSTLTLTWTNVTGEPTIDLFTAADTNGGTGYQTNATIAAIQVDPVQSPYIGRLCPSNQIQFTKSTWVKSQFIWCGVKYGGGGLVLTIADGNSNVLAQTTSYIALVDIKQMYERWTVGDGIGFTPMTNAIIAQDGIGGGGQPFQYGPPTAPNTPYILFVHGYNMPYWEKDKFAEAAFKRLYWLGYQGRFGVFRWPTYTQPILYYASEQQAWKSAAGLYNKLCDLNAEYPGQVYLMAHSMGNVVAGQALLMAGGNKLVNTYVASQAALSARAYDQTLPTDATNYYYPMSPDSIGEYYTSGSPSYFNGSAGAQTYIDFYNPADWALTGANLFQPTWLFFQESKLSTYTPTNDPTVNGLPVNNYYYTTPSTNHPSGYYFQNTTNGPCRNLLFPTNTFEIFAYADQSYSRALGAESEVQGVFDSDQEINLNISPFGFGGLHIGHSWQFRSDYPSTVAYWRQLLLSFNLKQ